MAKTSNNRGYILDVTPPKTFMQQFIVKSNYALMGLKTTNDKKIKVRIIEPDVLDDYMYLGDNGDYMPTGEDWR